MRTNLGLCDEGSIGVGSLILSEAGLIMWVWESERRWDEVKPISIKLLSKLHRSCKDILVRKQLDVRVAIAHPRWAFLEPFEDFIVRKIWV